MHNADDGQQPKNGNNASGGTISTCPNCGYCPHCGQAPRQVGPMPWYPYVPYHPWQPYVQPYPWQPTITWISTDPAPPTYWSGNTVTPPQYKFGSFT